MDTIAPSAGVGAPRAPLRCYWLEAKYELLRLLRTPSFAVPTLVFPPMFYLLFGVLLNGGHGGDAARYLLAGYGVFGVMGPGLFGLGVGIALDRDRGLLAYKRALPVPAGAMLLARLAMAMVFATVIALMLLALGLMLGGVLLPASRFALLLLVEIAGALPFCALGLYIGSVVSGQGAPAVINLVYLPMAFLSGLWIPLSMLPALLSKLAVLWPAWHLAQVAQQVVGGSSDGRLGLHLAVLAAMTLVLFLLARRRLARA